MTTDWQNDRDTEKNEALWEKPLRVPLCPSHLPKRDTTNGGMGSDRRLAVTGRRLTLR